MSEPEKPDENFLRRWSRRKQAAGTRAPADTEPQQSTHAELAPRPEANPQSEPEPPAFDPTSLPPIESISAVSDIRAFLAPGVPEELSRAALRRAWVIDPTIRDFVGLAENQWDFTRPDDVPGFGSLEITEQLRRMVTQLVGNAPVKAGASAASFAQQADKQVERLPQVAKQPPQVAEQEDRALEATAVPGAAHTAAQSQSVGLRAHPRTDAADAAAQAKPVDPARTSEAARRRHGGALPS
jgi:hypothetical protein